MNLFVIRHADAAHDAPTDYERELTDKGREQSKRLGRFLGALGARPDVILTSPLVRAVETAELLAASMSGEVPVTRDERLGCGMMPDEAYAAIWEHGKAGTVFLVGHQPDLSCLCADLAGMQSAGCFAMKKAACACFSLDKPGRGDAVLNWLVPPKLIADM